MKNKKDQLKKTLIHRFLINKITREELKNLHVDVNKNEDVFLQSIEEDWNDFSLDNSINWPEKHWDKLEGKLSPIITEDQSARVFRLQWWMKIAATLFIAISVWFIYRAEFLQKSVDDTPAMITKVNKSSKAKTVVLKDGTRVILAANSSLSYYKNFNKKYRVVRLEGEAYFETDEENTRPFIVIADNITSICRGKAFSISAFEESEEINILLGSGQIEIAQNDRLNSENNKVSVKSCQRYSFNKNSQEYLIGQIADCDFDAKVRSMKNSTSRKLAVL